MSRTASIQIRFTPVSRLSPDCLQANASIASVACSPGDYG
jgi:hypothetical protein